MQRCQRLQILQPGPAPGPNPDLTPDLTLGAAPAQDPENVAIGKSSFLFLTLTYIITPFCCVCGEYISFSFIYLKGQLPVQLSSCFQPQLSSDRQF